MNHIVFENSTIADVLEKAARVSPKEGSPQYSQTPGIHIQVAEDGSIIVRSTNGQVFYTQWSSSLEHSGGSWEWHITDRIAKWCSGLPTGHGKNVEFSEENGMLTMRHNRAVHKVSIIENMNYPLWQAFSEDDAVVISDMYAKVDQVQWAAALGSDDTIPALQGVCLDGESILATNGYRFAKSPLPFPPAMGRPVTFPHKLINPMIKLVPDVPVVVHQNSIGIIPDEYSQILVQLYAENPATQIRNIPTEYDHYLEFNNEVISSELGVMINSVGQADNPIVKLMMMNEKIIISMKGKGGDMAQDIIDVPGYAVHDYPCIVSYDPNYLLRAISNTPRRTARLHYNKENTKVNYISCDDYEAWISQRWENTGND